MRSGHSLGAGQEQILALQGLELSQEAQRSGMPDAAVLGTPLAKLLPDTMLARLHQQESVARLWSILERDRCLLD